MRRLARLALPDRPCPRADRVTYYVSERTFLPRGMDRDDLEAMHFAVRVTYRGHGLYSVDWSRSQLSSAGNWSAPGGPARRNRRFYRFPVVEAFQKAGAIVNDLKVGGRTWAEWEAPK